ncbi:MAG: tetratricopeptide repeat protein [Desulfobacterales bacterium]
MIDKTSQNAKPQAIVLPLRTMHHEDQESAGMGLHFLLGNVVILNSGLKEMWFGWRIKKIFPEYKQFISYCRCENPVLDITRLGHEQNIRYWIGGVVTDNRVKMELTDVSGKSTWIKEILFTCEDHLIGFRKKMMDWMAGCGLPLQNSEYKAALWPEKISTKGLRVFQAAMEDMYRLSSYNEKDRFEILSFETVVNESPASYMALDLLGWARYRRKEYGRAREAFLKALKENAAGVGVMAGLMWCSVMTCNEEEALYWATKKANTRQESIEAAREKTIRLLKKYREK